LFKNVFLSLFLLDINGYIGSMTSTKDNISKTRHYFTVFVKISHSNFAKVIVSNHKNMKSIRQQFLDFFHNKEPIIVSKVMPGKEVYFFNAYSFVHVSNKPITFNLNDSEAVELEAIDDAGLVTSVVGKIQFTTETVLHSYVKDGKSRSDKMREGILSDGTRTLKITVWGDLIEMIKENQLLQLCNLTSKEFDQKIVLTTNFSTCICFLTKDIDILHDTDVATESVQIKDRTIDICCPKVLSIRVHSFFSCKSCRARLDTAAGSGLAHCPKCQRDYCIDEVEKDKMCSQLLATMVIEKQDGTITSVTAFGDILQTICDISDIQNLKLKLLKLKNTDIIVDIRKMIVTKFQEHWI